MNIFLTGGTGFVGSAILPELLAAGHAVTALARSDESAAKLKAVGATPVLGELTDLATLRAAASKADATIHTAFIHDFSRYPEVARIDREAVEAMADAIAAAPSGPKVFINTAGTALAPLGRLVTERDAADTNGPAALRVPSERAALAAASRGVRSAVLRLPPSVHGEGDHAFVPILIDLARRTGVAAYPNDGANRWPAVHRTDAAALYRLAVEHLAAGKLPPGTVLHANAETGVPMRDIAQAIADGVRLGPAVSRPPEHFEWFAGFASIDNPTSSDLTRQWTGWTPKGPGLIDDLRGKAYAAQFAKAGE